PAAADAHDRSRAAPCASPTTAHTAGLHPHPAGAAARGRGPPLLRVGPGWGPGEHKQAALANSTKIEEQKSSCERLVQSPPPGPSDLLVGTGSSARALGSHSSTHRPDAARQVHSGHIHTRKTGSPIRACDGSTTHRGETDGHPRRRDYLAPAALHRRRAAQV